MNDKDKPLEQNPTGKKKKEANQYDNIVQENLDDIFLPLIQEALGVTIIKTSREEFAMHRTTKRTMDGFYWAETQTGERMLIHLEFQSTAKKDILYRVNEYVAMARRKFNDIPIKSFVFFLGDDEEPDIPSKLQPFQVFEGFSLHNFRIKNVEFNLASNVPSMVTLAILGNYRKEEAELLIQRIVNKLSSLYEDRHELFKYLDQLIILSELRKLGETTSKIVKDMILGIDYTNIPLFKEGYEKGVAEEQVKTQIEREKADLAEQKLQAAQEKI